MMQEYPAVFIMGILLSLGSVLGLLAEKVKFPRVVAYILVGAAFSDDLLGGVLHFSTEGWSSTITDLALGIIAYIIGSEIDLKELKKQKKTILSAVVGQSLGVLLFMGFGLWGLSLLLPSTEQISISQALIFGAVGTATAPAATLGVIEEFRAKGKMTTTLLGIIAVDDALGVIFFTLILGMAGTTGFSDSILDGLREVGGAVLIGGILGVLLGYLGSRFDKEELRLVTIMGFVFIVFGIAEASHFSTLLSCMTLGFVSVRFYPRKQAEWLLPLQHIEELVFIFFFTLAGTHFHPTIFASSLLLVLAYILLRVLGKYSGAYAGLLLVGEDKERRRLLGLCLFPQAGVAIGLAIRASQEPGFEEVGTLLLNIILGSTIIFGLTAPFLTKYALEKAGEISKSSQEKNSEGSKQ